MTNEPNNNDASGFDVADPGLEKLLGSVYDAPDIPRSLLKRIDRGVESEWGVSPELAPEQGKILKKPLLLAGRWVTAVPVAACLWIAVAWFALFGSNTGVCAWAAVVNAITNNGVLKIEQTDGVRWLALAEGVSGQQTSDSSSMSDARSRITLVRNTNSSQITRYHRAANNGAASKSELLVHFLSGSLDPESDRWSGLRVVSETSQSVEQNGQERYQLLVKFKTANETLDMDMTVDPKTLLPLTCELMCEGGDVVKSTVELSDDSLEELKQRDFPSDLAVVDAEGPSPEMVALDAVKPKSTEISRDASDAISETVPMIAEVGAAGLLKPATTWKPVNVVNRSADEVVARVDSVLQELWDSKNIKPVMTAGEKELLRRVYLDLVGRTPSVSEIQSYEKEPADTRYEDLVERLLASPDHASHLATVYRSFLIPEGVDLTAFGGVEAFDKWLAKRFEANEPYDEVVRKLLLSEGRLSRSGPLLFYSATKLDPDQLASRTSRVFLGMRLECAQCHDHPFEPWTQQDFWSLAAFFAQISRPQGELENVSTVMRVHDVSRGEVTLPETETIVRPKFLDGTPLDSFGTATSRRDQLAQWLTSEKNPYFARAAANRVWGHMFGAGIVNPIDDFGELNPPVSPELLETLASRLIDTNFDLRDLFRVVALSSAYRLSSGADSINEERLNAFAQMHVKTLTAEQIYDCITVASMLDSTVTNNASPLSINRFGNTSREQFLQLFRTPSQDRTSFQSGIPQALTMMNGSLIEGATGLTTSGLLKSLEAPFFSNRQRIEVIYMATLSRRPSDSDWKLLQDYLPQDASGEQLQQSMADLLWALLNSAEFTLNH